MEPDNEQIVIITKSLVHRYLRELKEIKSKYPHNLNKIILYWENKYNELTLKEN